MKVLFKNTTKYNKENCNNFMEFHNNKYGKKEIFKFIMWTTLISYMVIFNIIYKNWVLLIVASLLTMGLYFLNDSKQSKKKNEKIKEFTFYFYEKYIKIKCRRQFERMSYFEFYKIFETNEYFFLYLDNKKSLILNKEGFEVGTPREFSEFIRRKCPFKYSNERKK